MALAEGQIRIQVDWDGAAITAATVLAQRPRITTLLRGWSVSDALARIPVLYTLCGESQSVATEVLQDLVQQGEIPPEKPAAFAARIRLETVREHLWRIGLDWMPLVEMVTESTALREIMLQRQELLQEPERFQSWAEAALARLFGEDGDPRHPEPMSASHPLRFLHPRWIQESPARLARLTARLQPHLDGLGDGITRLSSAVALTTLREATEHGLLQDPDFGLRPVFAGQPLEMGPLARQLRRLKTGSEGGLDRFRVDTLSRFSARVAELYVLLQEIRRGMPAELALDAHQQGSRAMVALEMARGVLQHQVEVDNGRIRNYQIVAPTEWNFHPEGALHSGLLKVRTASREALQRAVQHQVMGLDPCVRYQLEIHHA